MSISKELFLSVLSMDTYNRGYEAGIAGLSENTNGTVSIGTATITHSLANTSLTAAGEAVGFYALAYQIDGNDVRGLDDETTVISYRGTNNALDQTRGWIVGGGWIEEGTQAPLAFDFYDAVTASIVPDDGLKDIYDQKYREIGPLDEVILTGHSLGGGLAGLVSAVTGTEGVGFDHMHYATAARMQDYLDLVDADGILTTAEYNRKLEEFADNPYFGTLNVDKFKGVSVANEILEGLRDGSLAGYGGGALAVVAAALKLPFGNIINEFGADHATIQAAFDEEIRAGNQQEFLQPDVHQGKFDLGDRALKLHMNELLVLLQYSDELAQGNPDQEGWRYIAEPLWDAFFNEDVAVAAGYGDLAGTASDLNQMGRAIAYSVLDEGTLVFGNTGIRALFDDMNELGLIDGDSSTGSWSNRYPFTFVDFIEALAQAVVQFAGQMALQKVDFNEANNAQSPIEGIIGFSDGGASISVSNDPNSTDAALETANADVLTINLSEELWSINKLNSGSSSSPEDIFTWIEDNVELGVRRTDPGGVVNPDAARDVVFSELYGDGNTSRVWNDIGFGEKYFYRLDVALQNDSETVVLSELQGLDSSATGNMAGLFAGGETAQSVIGNDGNTVFVMSDQDDEVIGLDGKDLIFGGGGDDLLYGGGGVDFIYGGAGNDFIVGGSGRDTIDGGSGWDVLSYAKYDEEAPTGGISKGVTVDLYDRELDPDADPAENTDASIKNVEVFIGSAQGDEFIGSQGGGEWFAGGEGNDTFTISRFASGNGPTVIWGGGGEDTIRISSERYISYDGYQRDLDFTELGILLVDVPDVTEENFHTLNFADLGLDPGFLYYGFDAIIINHEARDTVVERREGFEREAPPWNPVDEEGEGEGGPPQEPLNYGYFDQEIATVSVTEIISPYVQSLEGFNPEVTLVDRRGFGTDALVDPHVPGEAYAHPRYQRTKTIVADYHTFGIGDVDDGDYQEFTIFGGAAELGLRFSGLGLENTTLRNTSTSVDDYYFGAPLPIGSEEYNALRRGMDVSDFTTFGSPFGLYFDTLEEYPTLTNIVDFGGDRSNLTNASGSNDSWYIVGGSADENGITTAGAPETYTLSTEDNSITERLDALLGRSSSVGLIIDGTYGNDIINTSYQGPNGGSVSDEGQTINGFGGNDTITAGAGNDTINGGTQYDTIYAGDGDDVVAGDNGRDTVYLGNGNDIFNDNNQTGTHSLDTVYGGNGEDIINGGGGDDTFYGDSGDDLIFGGDGNDTIYGGSYYDTIHGGAGDDQVWGDNGRDTVYLGDGNDIFNDNTQTGTHSLDTVYAGNGNDTINGGGGDDTFYGDSGDDLIFGGDGNDTIYGGSYYDTIHGGAGDDQVWGDNGRDTVYLEAGDDVFNDNTQTGTHSLDTVFGGDGNDTINGGGGDDTFAGDAGDDTLTGGIGNDLLTGGLGADTFLFNDGDGADVVTDFDFSVDTIEVNGVAVDATALASGVSLVQAGADVTLSYGSGDTVTLQDVDLSAWDGSTGNAVIGQAGTATVTQGNSEQWFTVTFDQAITDAVVVLGPVEFNGSDPTTTRVRNVDDDGFEFQIDEWNYRDGGHIAESVGWMAVSAGHHTLANGVTIVAGVTQVNSTFETVNFGTTLTDAIVLSEVTTVLESDAVTTRHQNVTDTSFDVRLQEEEALGDHVDEDVSWIAIETGSYDGFEAVRTPNQVDEVADQFVFNSSFAETPVLLGDFQTFNGPDTSTMRFNDLDTNGVTLRLQEEASRDTELGHTNEVAGYLAIDDGWFV